jgi:hypothetical protein
MKNGTIGPIDACSFADIDPNRLNEAIAPGRPPPERRPPPDIATEIAGPPVHAGRLCAVRGCLGRSGGQLGGFLQAVFLS